jgi:O-antigen ligase
MVFGKFVALVLLLSLEVRRRSQIIIVMSALAISTVAVAWMSRNLLSASHVMLGNTDLSRIGTARTAGVLANSNVLGTYAALAATAAVVLAASTRRLALVLIAAPSFVCAVSLAFFSGSRKAILGMALFCPPAAWHAVRARWDIRNRASLVVLALLMIAGGALWWRINPFAARFNTSEASYVVREGLFRAACSMWLEHPLLGAGYRAFELKSGTGLYTHSTPVEMLVSGGVLGLGLYLALFWAVFRSIWRCLSIEQAPHERALLWGLGHLWAAMFTFGLFTVIIEEKVFLALCGCFCGYLRHKEHALTSEAGPADEEAHEDPP